MSYILGRREYIFVINWWWLELRTGTHKDVGKVKDWSAENGDMIHMILCVRRSYSPLATWAGAGVCESIHIGSSTICSTARWIFSKNSSNKRLKLQISMLPSYIATLSLLFSFIWYDVLCTHARLVSMKVHFGLTLDLPTNSQLKIIAEGTKWTTQIKEEPDDDESLARGTGRMQKVEITRATKLSVIMHQSLASKH
jgi:hypothetical protein